MSLAHAALLLVAAFFAGIVNSIAGGGMLLVFPMMIWLGLDPKIANATCTVALVPGLIGGLFGYRRTMDDSSIILMRLGVVSLFGGGVAAWLFFQTPSPTFARLVPFLIQSPAPTPPPNRLTTPRRIRMIELSSMVR